MYLLVHPSGSKYWRLKYRFDGKEKLLALGVYPEISLSDARERRFLARRQVAHGKDPNEIKKETKRLSDIQQRNSFEAIAREWHDQRKIGWSARYAANVLKRLETDILPKLGGRPIAAISSPELLGVLRIIEGRGALEVARRALKECGQVFMYAIATGRADRNPAADLQGALKTKPVRHFAHLAERELPAFMQALEAYIGDRQAKLATKFLLLTFVRTTELRAAQWSEFDLEKAEWRIPAERMKMRRDHVVPLSTQALAILKELKLKNGQGKYVFPNPYTPLRHMSENAILSVIGRMGYKGRATGHGFRHTASTILNENGFEPDHIERQLAHVSGNKTRSIYNHADYLLQRKQMMQRWGDYLTKTEITRSKANNIHFGN